MRHMLLSLVMAAVFLAASPVKAGLLDFTLDAEVGYSYLSSLDVQERSTILKGGVVGARAMLKILFITAVADYQHYFNNADTLHLGLGAGFGLPLSVVEPFFRGSLGLLLLDAKGSALDPSADSAINNEVGFQGRAGVGLDFPLGDWFAVGVMGELGYHYITGNHGWDFSVLGILGLRV